MVEQRWDKAYLQSGSGRLRMFQHSYRLCTYSGTNTDEVPNTSATAASLAPILMVWLRGKQLLLLNKECLNTRAKF